MSPIVGDLLKGQVRDNWTDFMRGCRLRRSSAGAVTNGTDTSRPACCSEGIAPGRLLDGEIVAGRSAQGCRSSGSTPSLEGRLLRRPPRSSSSPWRSTGTTGGRLPFSKRAPSSRNRRRDACRRSTPAMQMGSRSRCGHRGDPPTTQAHRRLTVPRDRWDSHDLSVRLTDERTIIGRSEHR
jgi:hypothetical protein